MYLTITQERFIREIQQEFNQWFPFLKLEFFPRSPKGTSDHSFRKIIPGDRKLGEMHVLRKDGVIEVDEAMKVNDLEQIFQTQFGLSAQVFRKSGPVWLETTKTDNWTLAKQNRHGQELSIPPSNIDSTEDFDLTRDAEH